MFIHIPKCAGTSVGQAISRTIHPFSRNVLNYQAANTAGMLLADKKITTSGLPDDLPYLQFLLCYQLNRGFRYVGGHYPVSKQILQEYEGKYQFVTLLRDPIKRWKSDFAFQSGLRNRGTPSVSMSLEKQFEWVVTSKLGLLMGTLMCSMLTGKYPDTPEHAENLAPAACETLSLFSVVGKVEKLDEFRTGFEQATKAKIVIGHKNQSRDLYKGHRQDQLLEMNEFLNRDDISRSIAKLCEADAALIRQYGLA